jgi:hypothetical protein
LVEEKSDAAALEGAGDVGTGDGEDRQLAVFGGLAGVLKDLVRINV